MTVRIERNGAVWTVIHSRPEARNAMDPASAQALVAAFNEFNEDASASVAVLWGEGGAFCAGFDLKHAGTMVGAEHPLEALHKAPNSFLQLLADDIVEARRAILPPRADKAEHRDEYPDEYVEKPLGQDSSRMGDAR